MFIVQNAENTEKLKEENPLPEISPVKNRHVDIFMYFLPVIFLQGRFHSSAAQPSM